MTKGKLIVIEGADGSGKTTQSKLLLKYFKNLPAGGKIPSAYISFPRYETKWGKIIRKYLEGGMGNLGPYDTSVFYANDRKSAAGQINKWLIDGKVVVCNRYIGSNAAHMGAKFETQEERTKYIKWLEKLEYEENQIPKEDLVIFLYVPIAVSKKLMKGRNLDIHERDLKYQEEVLAVYDSLCSAKKNWVKVDCTKNGKMLTADEIHKNVLEALKQRKILPESTRRFVLSLNSTDIVIDADKGIEGFKK